MRRPVLGLLVVGLGSLAAALDTSVNIAFPAISAAFGLTVADIRWVVISYVLTYSSLMLAFGKLGDLIGYRRVFRLGLVISAFGFVACALSAEFGWLLAGRMLQGVGVALTLSCAPALATILYEEVHRGRVLGAYASMSAVGVALGPLIGGALVEQWGWSAVFAFRAPIVLLALACSPLLPAGSNTGKTRAFDGLGAVLLTLWTSAALLALAVPAGPLGGYLSPALAALALASFAGFLVREAKVEEPIVRLGLFRDLNFSVLNLASIAVNLVSFGVLLLVPYYLDRIQGLTAIVGGVLLATSATGTVIGSALAGRHSAALGARRVALAGALFAAAGLWAISCFQRDTAVAAISAVLLLQGIGLGLFQVAYSDIVTGTLPLRERGVAGSLAMVTRTIGIVSGATGLSALHGHLERRALDDQPGLSVDATFLWSFQHTFELAAAALALFILAMLLARPRAWLAGS